MEIKVQILIFVIALFAGNAFSQSCYHCASLSYNNNLDVDLPTPQAWQGSYPSCDDGNLETVDCSSAGGCLKLDFNYEFNVNTDQKNGALSSAMVIRDCGANLDKCDRATEAQFNAQKALINTNLPPGYEFVSGSGNACFCSGNLCNGAPIFSISLTALFASLCVSYIVIKW